ncbi:thioredoxin-like protein [Pluteus cervinus]|uniref:Thioredoxin-like protein n=1 Tax=Pluteus cervinus TaxID=181527 RepID=A0ACD3BEJ0_9AGAR|nr:thioredoxin-like protein [Pluteus cervinus]
MSLSATTRIIVGQRSLSRIVSLRQFHSSPCRRDLYPKATQETFLKTTAAKDRIVLVDFYADWCGPCRVLSPILERLVEDPDTKSGSGLPLDLVTINTEDTEGAQLGQKYKVRALPTVVAFRDGKPIDQFVGALAEPHVVNFLKGV